MLEVQTRLNPVYAFLLKGQISFVEKIYNRPMKISECEENC